MVKIANYLKFVSTLLKQIADVFGNLIPEWKRIQDNIKNEKYE